MIELPRPHVGQLRHKITIRKQTQAGRAAAGFGGAADAGKTTIEAWAAITPRAIDEVETREGTGIGSIALYSVFAHWSVIKNVQSQDIIDTPHDGSMRVLNVRRLDDYHLFGEIEAQRVNERGAVDPA